MRALPKGVIRDLSLARTRAIRMLLARDRDTALAVTVAAMIARTVFHGEVAGVGVTAQAARMDDLEPLEETRNMQLSHLPEEEDAVLDWCLAQPAGTLLSLLAVLVAGSLDVSHEKGSLSDQRRRLTADTLAAALGLDMSQFWRADAGFWTRLPKAMLLAALAEGKALADLTPGARDASLKALAKLRKDDLAARADEAFEGTGYLPDLLVTAIPAGAIELTANGVALVAAE